MALELGNSPLEDPLSDCSLLYLLPKTLGSAPSHALLAASEAEELGSIENLFESMVMEGSTQLLQQAQRITKNHTNIDTLYPEDEPVAENFKDRHSERRPALGLKRAKFSLKPAPSDSLQNIDFSSIIDDIDDPEEYFLAFEQLEIAEKELKKLRGKVSTDLGLHHQGTTTRERRPGLRGKTASYKHHISANFDTADTLVELQEKLVDRRIASSTYSSVNVEPSNLFHSEPVDEPGTSQAKDANIELQAAVENEGSIAEKENKVDNLLENLLSSFNNFDEEEGKTYLRDSLQIRSIDAGKMHLPALPNTQLSQHSTFNRKAMCRELKVTQNSRPLTKSPLATLSTLRKRLSLIGPLEDLNFLSPSDDAPSSGDPSFSKSAYSESLSPVKVGNDDNSGIAFNDDSSPVVENGTALGFVDDISPLVRADRSTGKKIVSKENLTKNRYTLLEKNTNPDKGNLADEVHPKHLADEFDGSLQEVNDRQLDPVITDEPDAGIEGCSNHSGIQDNLGFPTQLLVENTDGDSNAPDKDKDASGISFGGLQEGDNMQQDVSITKQPNTGVELLASNCADQITTESIISPHNRNMGENCSNSAINSKTGISGLDETAQSKVNAKVQEKVFDAGTSKDNSSPPEAPILTDHQLENLRSLAEENNEEHQMESGAPSNEGRKQSARTRTSNKRKFLSGRKSLSDNSSPPEAPILTDRQMENVCSLADINEEHQMASGAPSNEGRKQSARTRMSNKRNSLSGRKSLSGAGMIWEDGRRKSSRRRFRPLQHWRGERLLYGRIHNSLATVIGMKYRSPGKSGLKVESYVSEEYADLVAQVARC